MLTDQEEATIRQYNTAQALLDPFKRILEGWSVGYRRYARDQISALQLVATGDLESNWRIQVRAADTGVVVAEFVFPEYGRLFDMRRVEYRYPPPAEELEDWVKSKVDKGQIKYSTLAAKRGLAFTDPRVIHDIAYRISRSDKFKLPRRRWYNKGKEANIRDLYKQLQEAMADAVIASTRADFHQV